MVHRSRLCFGACLLLAVATGPVHGLQRPRVSEDAPQIRGFRLNEDHLARLRQVAQTLARGLKPTPERPRADAALFVMLSMSLAYNEPFRDSTVADMVRTIESGHQDLDAAIRAAGLTASDYVLTQISLLLTFPVVAGEKAGGAAARSTDTAAENVAFVRRHWSEVESILKELGAATGQPQP